jgi:CBS domain-containing protein
VVGDVAPAQLTIEATATAAMAARKMLDHGVRHLVVTEAARDVGVLSTRDLLAVLASGERSQAPLGAVGRAGGEHPEHWWG